MVSRQARPLPESSSLVFSFFLDVPKLILFFKSPATPSLACTLPLLSCGSRLHVYWTREVMRVAPAFGLSDNGTCCSGSGHKNVAWVPPSREQWHAVQMQFQLWHACWKPCSSHASSFLRKWTSSFFFLSNLPLPVSEHFNLLYLHHTAFATFFFFFFWLNIEPC